MTVLAKSRLTAQGQVSVPVEVRKRLGIEPGSVLEWREEGGRMTVRPSGKYTFENIHNKVFRGRKPKPRTLQELKEGLELAVADHHARR